VPTSSAHCRLHLSVLARWPVSESLCLVQYKLALAHYRLSIFTYAKLNFHLFSLTVACCYCNYSLVKVPAWVACATWTVCRYFDRQSSPLSRGEERKSFSCNLCFIRCFVWVYLDLTRGNKKGLGTRRKPSQVWVWRVMLSGCYLCVVQSHDLFIPSWTAYFQSISTRFTIIRNSFYFVKAIWLDSWSNFAAFFAPLFPRTRLIIRICNPHVKEISGAILIFLRVGRHGLAGHGVEMRRLELLTSTMQMWRSPN
jgi:hypothetical protein